MKPCYALLSLCVFCLCRMMRPRSLTTTPTTPAQEGCARTSTQTQVCLVALTPQSLTHLRTFMCAHVVVIIIIIIIITTMYHHHRHHHNYHLHCHHHHQFVITTISINVLQRFVADSVTCTNCYCSRSRHTSNFSGAASCSVQHHL